MRPISYLVASVLTFTACAGFSAAATSTISTKSLSKTETRSGGADAGGGDLYALQFIALGQEIVQNYATMGLDKIESFSREEFAAAVKNTKVETQDRTFLGTREVDAINYPSKGLIQLSRARWDEANQKNAKDIDLLYLVAHEYIGIATKGQADGDLYLATSGLLRKARPRMAHKSFKKSFACQTRLSVNGKYVIADSTQVDLPTTKFIRLENPGSQPGELGLYVVLLNKYGRGENFEPILSYSIVKYDNRHDQDNRKVVKGWQRIEFRTGDGDSEQIPLIHFDDAANTLVKAADLRCYKYDDSADPRRAAPSPYESLYLEKP